MTITKKVEKRMTKKNHKKEKERNIRFVELPLSIAHLE